MQGITTVTQKGQVAIPKEIRDHLHLNPFDKIKFTLEGGKIIGRPLPTTAAMRGFIQSARRLTQQESKRIIRKKIIEKYEGST